jgi:hypothetical protein
MRRCKCGNDVASNARVCPRCGHRFTSTLTWAIVAIVGLMIAAAIIGSFSGGGGQPAQPASSPADLAAQQKQDAADKSALMGAMELRSSMRNPGSFVLTGVLTMEDGATCYSYRAQNGFGGMTAGAAVLSPTGRFKTSEMEGFRGLWSKECAGKSGHDSTWLVEHNMKALGAIQ